MQKSLIVISCLVVCAFLVFLSTKTKAQPEPLPPPVAGQLRGLWVDAFGAGIRNPQEIDQLISEAKTMRLNAIFAQIGKRGDCYCNNAAMPRTTDPAVPIGFDPLAYLLEKAHAQGIQVHAWIITTAIHNAATAPTDPNHVFNLHGITAQGRNNWLMTRADGANKAGNDYLLDPGHPDAAEYIANMYLSVVKNYTVDGIQFDRVRYPDFNQTALQPTWGYNPTALERFKLEANRPEINLADTTTFPSPTDAVWMQWRRDQITNLVRRVYLEVKRIRPEIWVSAATITYGAGPKDVLEWQNTRTYTEVLQDWQGWMQEGILDLNIPMNYKRDHLPEQAQWFDQWNIFAAAQRSTRAVAIGTAMYLNYQDGTVKQIQSSFAREGISGWVGYSYRTPDSDVNAGTSKKEDVIPALTTKLTSSVFSSEATWSTAPTQQLSGLLGRLSKNGVALSGQEILVIANGIIIRKLMTDGNGYFGTSILPVGEINLSYGNSSGVTKIETGTVAYLELKAE